ncbi:serine hydrolase domain-containing protein [Glycomyces tritici]|uniref:Serine hydrolase domain-containing protein n=1 Tax=Glycomyces tritici TaxID=2665176 RepID=A0ABT7YV81_9ACTN|nr:serine hydrolase domain-containing protein [Glycomyces tritici]MDN3242541.1 serine hydrolase domain-containing protein [Glycomyces tritici]
MTRTIRQWLPVIAFAVAAVLPAAPAQAADHAATQALLNQYQAQAGPGAGLHAGEGTESWTLTSGSATIFANRPITAGDHFRIASQTKTFTAAVVLQLVDEGLVELDAPIERYLPGVLTGDYDGNAISVRQILQHTSGIARDALNAAPEPDGSYTLTELVRAGLAQPPQFAPGSGWGYSNINYHLAGMLIEELTGVSAAEAITQRIIEPLGLTGTSFPVPDDGTLPSPYLPGYTGGRLGPFFYWYDVTFIEDMSFNATAGAMTSTMEDLVAFYGALAAGSVVSAGSLAEMRTAVPSTVYGADYGLGLMSWDLSCGGEAWGHAGNLTTGASSITMVTDDGRFASLVTNAFLKDPPAPTRVAVLDAALCEGEAA